MTSALGRWRTQLEGIPEGALDAIGPMLGRLDALVGPLRHRPEPGGGEPDGVSGLGRRGSWERLALTEWALAEVAPDEFLRRATSGEQLFQQLARRSPQAGRACRVLLDAGPDQLGAPRVAQLALLVVLARRAERAGADFFWGPAQRDRMRQGWDGTSATRHFDDRTVEDPSADGVAQHLEADDGPGVEWWLIGGSALLELAGPQALRVHVREAFLPEPSLEVSVVRPQGGQRTVRLDEVPPQVVKVAIRRPLPTLEPAMPRAEGPGDPDEWNDLRFTDEGSRLLGLHANQRLTAVKVERARRQNRITFRAPDGGTLAAVGWHNRRPIRVSVGPAGWSPHGTVAWTLHGVHAPTWSGPPPDEGVGSLVCFLARGQEKVCILDGSGRTWLVPLTGPLHDVVPGDGLALVRRSGVPLLVRNHEGRCQVMMHPIGQDAFEVVHEWPRIALQVWVGPSPRGSRTGVFALQFEPHEVELWVGSRRAMPPIRLEAGDVVCGVTCREGSGEVSPRLLVRSADRALWLVGGGRVPVPHAQDVVLACCSPGGPHIAWLDLHETVRIYDVSRERDGRRIETAGAP